MDAVNKTTQAVFQPNPLTQKDWNWVRIRLKSSKKASFQPNPLTQKDWNLRNGDLSQRESYLPTKSIDPEGLKQKAYYPTSSGVISSNQIHWPRRIETMKNRPWKSNARHFQPNPLTQKDWNRCSLVCEKLVGYLPTKSIDPEGLKHHAWNNTYDISSPSNQIHWPRRIETPMPGLIAFLGSPSNQIHWPRRIETFA